MTKNSHLGKIIFLLSIILFFLTDSLFGEIYKCESESGNLIYSDDPCGDEPQIIEHDIDEKAYPNTELDKRPLRYFKMGLNHFMESPETLNNGPKKQYNIKNSHAKELFAILAREKNQKLNIGRVNPENSTAFILKKETVNNHDDWLSVITNLADKFKVKLWIKSYEIDVIPNNFFPYRNPSIIEKIVWKGEAVQVNYEGPITAFTRRPKSIISRDILRNNITDIRYNYISSFGDNLFFSGSSKPSHQNIWNTYIFSSPANKDEHQLFKSFNPEEIINIDAFMNYFSNKSIYIDKKYKPIVNLEKGFIKKNLLKYPKIFHISDNGIVRFSTQTALKDNDSEDSVSFIFESLEENPIAVKYLGYLGKEKEIIQYESTERGLLAWNPTLSHTRHPYNEKGKKILEFHNDNYSSPNIRFKFEDDRVSILDYYQINENLIMIYIDLGISSLEEDVALLIDMTFKKSYLIPGYIFNYNYSRWKFFSVPGKRGLWSIGSGAGITQTIRTEFFNY